MSFKAMMRDTIALVKKGGGRREGIKASVQPTQVITFETGADFEDGDRLERVLPNGRVESYLILDAGYHPGLHSIPASFQMRVRRESAIPTPHGTPSVSYSVQGANARINIQSVDRSSNVALAGADEVFVGIRAALTSGIADEGDLRKILAKLDELQQTAGTPGFGASYKAFISVLADHVSLAAPFLPALTNLL